MRALLLVVGLVLLPGLLLLVAFAKKYRGLDSPTALEHAQLARHLAAGDGFVTSLVRPLAIALHPGDGIQPDLYNPPVHPVVVALGFWAAHPSGRVMAVVGTLLWLVGAWLTFFVAWRWRGARTAALATVFYAANAVLLNAAIGGQALPLLGIWVLLVVWLALPQITATEGQDHTLAGWRIWLAGLVCGLAMLTHYLLIVLLPIVCVCVLAQRRRKVYALAMVGLGFVVALLPWCARNLLVTGNPFFSLYWYNLLADTSTFPGSTVWRGVDLPPNPLWFVLTNPLEMKRKLLAGLVRGWSPSVAALGLVISLLFVATALSGGLARRIRGLLGVVLAGVALSLVAGALFWVEPEFVGCWAPLVSIVAAIGVREAVRARVGALVFAGITADQIKRLVLLRRRRPEAEPAMVAFTIPEPIMRGIALGIVILAVGLPLIGFLVVPLRDSEAQRVEALRPLRRLLPATATVATDQPHEVAWYGRCRALWLWRRESDLPVLEQSVGRVDALFLTPALRQLAPAEFSDWWGWVVSPRGNYQGFRPALPVARRALVRLRATKAEEQSGLAREISRLRELVQTNRDSAELRVWLATRLLAADRLRDADSEFLEAHRLDPQNSEAVLGQWQTVARLNDELNSMSFIQYAAQLEPRDPVSIRVLEEVAGSLDAGLERNPRDPWLLYHAARYQARLQQWDRAESYCQRVSQLSPDALPAGLLIGDLYLEHGQPDRAAAVFAALASERTRSAVAREALGRARWEQGRREEATQEYAAAMQLRPDWRVPYLRAGAAYLELKDYAAARHHFTKALELFPGLLPARFGLADVHRAQGQDAEAVAIYEAVLAEYPDNRVALNNLAYHYARTGQNLARALELAQAACRVAPKDGAALDTLGWILYLRGEYPEAVEVLVQAARLAPPDNGLRHFHLGKALLAADRAEEAREVLRMAVNRGLPAAQEEEAKMLLGLSR